MELISIHLQVNSFTYTLTVRPYATLLDVLRDQLGLTGTHEGCRVGECGSCTVLLDGRAVNACLVLAPDAAGADLQTVEGLGHSGTLNGLQQSFVRHGAVQCGYCASGMLMSATAFLREHAGEPIDETSVRRALAGNLCRCTGYTKIVQAVMASANE